MILKGKLVTEFELEDLGIIHNFLDCEVWQKTERDNGESRKVRCGDPEEIRNNGLGIHDYTDDDGYW